VDKQVGRLVSALDELGLRERTIIIVTTDNGSTRGITGTRNGRKVQGAKGQKSEAGGSKISPPA
jgi:arylsulfatase A-like enzyme